MEEEVGKYFEKEYIWSMEKKKNREGKEESFGEGKLIVTPTNRQPGEYIPICLFEVRNQKSRNSEVCACLFFLHVPIELKSAENILASVLILSSLKNKIAHLDADKKGS